MACTQIYFVCVPCHSRWETITFIFQLAVFALAFVITLDRKEGVEIRKQGTEIGKAMAEKSKGLFSADDWQCKT